ncbi:MAG TPA: beta-galactosidase [Woeseiaceae bacterium]|nr:beta-galactosidase [Woeseiaceae bacterium]
MRIQRLLLPLIFSLVLLLPCSVLFSLDANAQQDSSATWGIHKIWGSNELDELPFVRGGYVAIEWADLNPSPGVFNFSVLDSELARYDALGKKAQVIVRGSYKPDFLFKEVPYNPKKLTLQVDNEQGTLQYWHPTYKTRHQQLLEALADHLKNSPYKSVIYSIRQSLNAVGTEHSGIEESERAQSKWVVPPGVEFVPYTDARNDAYSFWVSETYYDLFANDFLVLIRSNVAASTSKLLPDTVIAGLKSGKVGLMHTTSMAEPTSRSTYGQYEEHIKYGKNGATPVYAEPVSSSTKGSHGDQSPPQWNYWRILSDLFAGVTYISVYGSDLDDYRDIEYAAAFNFADRYAGYQTGKNPAASPGAWVALRAGGEYLTGDYTFLMNRIAGDKNEALKSVGPEWQRFGAWARRVPAGGRMRFRLDTRFANAIAGQGVTLRVTYFDSRNPRFSVRTESGASQNLRGSATGTWKTIDMPLGSSSAWGQGDADITISATTDVTFHMVEVVRTSVLIAAGEASPEPPANLK